MISVLAIPKKLTYNIIIMIYLAILLFLTIVIVGLTSDEEFTCLSDAWYVMHTNFTCAMFGLAFLVVIPAIEHTPHEYTFLAFLMCVLIAFVGVAGDYKANGLIRNVHLISALLSAICSVTWVILVSPASLSYGVIVALSLVERKRWLLWLEMACFAMVFRALLVQ